MKSKATIITQIPAQTLEWSRTLCEECVDHATAENLCAALGEGWRLPTRAERISLVDLTRSNPAIDTEQFPDTQSDLYWTSDSVAADSAYAWVVGFYSGNSDDYLRGYDDAFVRAVRVLPARQ